ncbi:hypothetical protein HCH44_17250 [Sphingomonas melonis]|uniref:hypothetical protein n=1 Tax=Sphingomonas melonis TaxID=152682 RepID=UPI001C8C5BC2|nr:hypothetical protein [Sphingomonas melonis]MBX8846648.1 hypothetical protein [Sphingomonas melonis]MBX8855763.1 hypothetical protein [Sphingomonas melonis]MBX8900747.1 hypothetical protein [Sphingomonas melonis]
MPAILLTALALTQAAPLPATLPARFYNRPGARAATRDADLARCLAIATQSVDDIGPAVVKDRRLTPAIGTARDASPTAPGDPIETCMSNRGWQLYALTSRERAAWTRLSAPARARLADTLTGAAQPRWGHLVWPASRLRLNGGSPKQ